jgi:predicted ATPase
VWAGETIEDEEGATSQKIELDDNTQLGITTLGQLKDHPRIVGLRTYIESWYLSYFIPDAARSLPPVGAHKHLNRTGENLGNVVQYLERSHPKHFRTILERIAKKIPGIQEIRHVKSPDGRLLLRFNEQGYKDPFYQQSMSDGTLKIFVYLILLEDPEPQPFIGIEEPENGLYHKLLEELAREFRRHAEKDKQRTQILITTHSPYFVDALTPEQVFLMEKDERGHTQIKRTADMPVISELESEGIPLGSLWYSNHFEERFQP